MWLRDNGFKWRRDRDAIGFIKIHREKWGTVNGVALVIACYATVDMEGMKMLRIGDNRRIIWLEILIVTLKWLSKSTQKKKSPNHRWVLSMAYCNIYASEKSKNWAVFGSITLATKKFVNWSTFYFNYQQCSDLGIRLWARALHGALRKSKTV